MKPHTLSRLLFLLAALALPAAAGARDEDFRFATTRELFSTVDPGDLKAMFDVVFSGLDLGSGTYGVRVYDSDDAFLGALRENTVDVFALKTRYFLEIRGLVPVEAAMCVEINERPTEKFVLLAKSDGTERGLKDFENPRLVIDATHDLETQYMWLDTVLDGNGLPSRETAFDSIEVTQKPARAILPVSFGKRELCLTTRRSFESMAELKPHVAKQLVVVTESDPLLTVLMGFRKSFEAKGKAIVLREMAHLHQSAKGRQALMLSKAERIVPFDPKWLEGMEALVTRHAELERKKNNETYASRESEN